MCLRDKMSDRVGERNRQGQRYNIETQNNQLIL